jgi:hypothetical protein
MEKTEKTAIEKREKIKQILLDHMCDITGNIFVEDKSEANSMQLAVFVDPYESDRYAWYGLQKAERSEIDQFAPEPGIYMFRLHCMNIYDYVDDPHNKEKMWSFWSSHKAENEILREIDEQLAQLQ